MQKRNEVWSSLVSAREQTSVFIETGWIKLSTSNNYLTCIDLASYFFYNLEFFAFSTSLHLPSLSQKSKASPIPSIWIAEFEKEILNLSFDFSIVISRLDL